MLDQLMAKSMAMDDRSWERHANPWSAWTRVWTLPVIVLAVWSRVWIGPWAWVLVAALVVWVFVNPRAFPPPKTTRRWSSMAVMGERVWLNRHRIPIPKHHAFAATMLSGLAALGAPFLVWGLWKLEFWPTLVGLVFVYAFKMWFLDRMVWLYRDMARRHAGYRAWLR